MRRSRRARRYVAVAVVGAVAAPLVARAASLSVTSEHLTTVATCGLIAYSSTSGVDNDSYVDQSQPTTNEGSGGSANNLDVQSSTTSNQRTYVRFDLTKCIFRPASTVIVRGAWLRLFVTKVAATCRTIDVFAIGSAWTDTTITWNNQPNPPGTTLNSPSSGRTALQAIGNATGCTTRTTGNYVSWDVTSDVAAFIAGTSANNGWMLRDDLEGGGSAQQTVFAAINANKDTQGPALMISYTVL